jgi:hypothetical protein
MACDETELRGLNSELPLGVCVSLPRRLAAILTYIRNAWGSSATALKAEEVTEVRKDTALRPD